LGGEFLQATDQNIDILAGPEIRLLDKGRADIRLQAKAGLVSRLNLDPVRGTQRNEWSFASTIGSSIDIRLTSDFAWRVVYPEIVWRNRGGSRTEFRVSTGVVLRWGETR